MRIVARGVTREHGERGARTRALDAVSFELEDGEYVAIVGTSGSGKTTLLNVIGGLDRAFTGEVLLDGVSLGAMSDAALSRLRNARFGFVFQHFHLLDHLSCLENVVLPQSFATGGARVDMQAARDRARDLLVRLGLAEKVDALPGALSGGQKQRVAIARALLHQPRLLLCDEPTGSLDRKTGEQIMEVFESLNREEGISVIIVTHEAHIAARARRTLVLEDGALIEDRRHDATPAEEE